MTQNIAIGLLLALLLGGCGDDVAYKNGQGTDNNNTTNDNAACNDDLDCEGLTSDTCIGQGQCVSGECVFACENDECIAVEDELREAREAARACQPDCGCILVQNIGVCDCGGTALSAKADLDTIAALGQEFQACFNTRCEPCEAPLGAACVEGQCQEIYSSD